MKVSKFCRINNNDWIKFWRYVFSDVEGLSEILFKMEKNFPKAQSKFFMGGDLIKQI